MPGNYSHNTITNGTVLSDTRYNADHQNHIDNHTPLGLDDYSANVAQMQSTVDPGEVGSESLATSTAGEMERIRFVLKEMKGTNQWYESHRLKQQTVALVVNHSLGLFAGWLDAVETNIYCQFVVPHDWVSGTDLFLVFVRRSSVTTGTAIMNYSVHRARAAAALTTVTGFTAINYTPANTNSQFVTLTLANASFTFSDTGIVTLQRLGADGGDTLAASLDFHGAYLQYTGFSGRG